MQAHTGDNNNGDECLSPLVETAPITPWLRPSMVLGLHQYPARMLPSSGIRAGGILGFHRCPKPSFPHPRPADGCVGRGCRSLCGPTAPMTLWEQHGVPGAYQSTAKSPHHGRPCAPSRCSPCCPHPAVYSPPWLMPAASGPQMGAVASDLLTPAGRGQQARCT